MYIFKGTELITLSKIKNSHTCYKISVVSYTYIHIYVYVINQDSVRDNAKGLSKDKYIVTSQVLLWKFTKIEQTFLSVKAIHNPPLKWECWTLETPTNSLII